MFNIIVSLFSENNELAYRTLDGVLYKYQLEFPIQNEIITMVTCDWDFPVQKKIIPTLLCLSFSDTFSALLLTGVYH